MAVWNTISCSKLTIEHRIDAEFFQPLYQKLDDTLDSLPFIGKLGDLSLFIKKGIFDISPTKYKNKGIPLIRTSQIKNAITTTEGLVYLSELEHKNSYFKTELLAGDVVFTKIGAGIGDIAVLSKQHEKYNFSQNVAGVSVNRAKIDQHYLAAFLLSEIGRRQILRYMMPSGQGKLELRDIKKIRIGRFANEEKQIGEMMRKAEECIQISFLAYEKAQQLLESALGLDKLRFQKPVGYTARFSEMELSRRLDAQHYQAQFTQLLDHLAKFPNRKVRDIRTCNRRGIQPVYVSDGAYDVVNSQHLGPKHINYDGLQKTSPQAFAASPVAHIRQNDLLIYTTGAYIGRTNVYLSDNPAFASNHVNILRLTPDIDAAYMAMVFQSVVGQFQTQKHSRGSAQAELYPNDIDKFVVPILPFEQQTIIGDLVRESLVKQHESARLLEQAKTRVEQLIEEAVQP